MAPRDTPTWFYRPRPQRVWNLKRNPELTKCVDLEVTLSGAGTKSAVQHWIGVIGARQEHEHVFVHGGAAIEILTMCSGDIALLLSSGGQDALESLDELVESLHENIVLPHPDIAVKWVGKPIYN